MQKAITLKDNKKTSMAQGTDEYDTWKQQPSNVTLAFETLLSMMDVQGI
jgi:hypothetical protein